MLCVVRQHRCSQRDQVFVCIFLMLGVCSVCIILMAEDSAVSACLDMTTLACVALCIALTGALILMAEDSAVIQSMQGWFLLWPSLT